MSRASITIEGFVSNDLSVRQAGAHRVVEVSVPHTPQKEEHGQWVDAGPTTWYSATFWDEYADGVLDAIQKGSLVQLTGGLELDVYSKRDGTPGARLKLVRPTIAVVVRKPRKGAGQPPAAPEVWHEPGAAPVEQFPAYADETPF